LTIFYTLSIISKKEVMMENHFFGLLTIEEEQYKPQNLNSNSPPKQNDIAMKSGSSPLNNNNKKKESNMNSISFNENNNNNQSNGIPQLIPIGEVLNSDGQKINNNSIICDEVLPTRPDTDLLAAKEKEQGNIAFSAGNYPLALIHYSRAIKLNWKEPVFYSNRALVYLKMNRYYESISDCTASFDRKGNIKAYAWRAAAWAMLKEFFLAAEDYKRALRFEAKNQDCLIELERCLIQLEKDYQQKVDSNSVNNNSHYYPSANSTGGTTTENNEKLKKSLINVREDLKKKLHQKLKDLKK